MLWSSLVAAPPNTSGSTCASLKLSITSQRLINRWPPSAMPRKSSPRLTSSRGKSAAPIPLSVLVWPKPAARTSILSRPRPGPRIPPGSPSFSLSSAQRSSCNFRIDYLHPPILKNESHLRLPSSPLPKNSSKEDNFLFGIPRKGNSSSHGKRQHQKRRHRHPHWRR